MAEKGRPGIVSTAATAWGDTFRVAQAMPGVAGIGFVIMVVIALATLWVMPNPVALAQTNWVHVIGFVANIVQSILIAPLAIAAHRYVILGETTSGYPLDPSTPRYQQFVIFAIAVNALWSIPTLVQTFIPAGTDNLVMGSVGSIIIIALFVTIIVVVVRRAIPFPAIAVDAVGATWSNAREDTEGHSWRVAFVFICVAVPLLILVGPMYYLLFTPPLPTMGVRIALTFVTTIIQVLALCAFAAAASRVFLAFADNLARDQAPVPAKPWSLSKAALSGLLLMLVVFVAGLVGTWIGTRPPNPWLRLGDTSLLALAAHWVGVFAAGPILFVLVTLIRNLFVRIRNLFI